MFYPTHFGSGSCNSEVVRLRNHIASLSARADSFRRHGDFAKARRAEEIAERERLDLQAITGERA